MRIRTPKTVLPLIVLFILGFSALETTCTADVVNPNVNIISKQNGINSRRVMLVSGNPNYPPFMWKQGETITGVGAELIKAICAELVIPLEIKWCGPWKRVQKNALEGNIDLIMGLYMNDERREYLDYTAAYMTEPVVITVSKENTFSFKNRNDLIGKVGIAIHGDSFGQDFDDYMRSKLNVRRTYTVEALYRNILAGHAEYIVRGYSSVRASASRLGFKDKIRIATPHVATENIYMAFSKKSVFRKNLKQMNAIIQRLKKNSTVKKLMDQYLLIYDAEKHLPVE